MAGGKTGKGFMWENTVELFWKFKVIVAIVYGRKIDATDQQF